MKKESTGPNEKEKKPDDRIMERVSIHFDGGTVNVIHMEFLDNNTVEHRHKHSAHEVYYCLNGRLRMTIEEEGFILEKNHFLIVPPGMEHRVHHDPEDRLEGFLMLFRGTPREHSAEDSVFGNIHDLLKKKNCILYGEDLFGADKAIAAIKEERRSRMLGSDDLLQSYYQQFFILLFRNFFPEVSRQILTTQGVNLAVQITEFIKANLDKDLDKNQIAEGVHITPRHADRIYNDFFGEPVMKGLKTFRVLHAKDLLKDESLSMEKITELCGFSSERALRKAFREIEGISAADYRQALKKSSAGTTTEK